MPFGARAMHRIPVVLTIAVLAALLLPGAVTAAHAAAATPTTTAVTVIPGTGFGCEDVVLSAAVAPVAPGTVQFSEGAVLVGGPVPVDGAGYAGLTTDGLGAGDHTITATFTPTDHDGHLASSSSSPAFRLDACRVGPPDDQAITADVAAGELTVDTPYTPTNPIVVGPLTLSPDATHYGRGADIAGISVLDTRAGAQAWTLTALSSDLLSGNRVIDAQNVGLVDVHEVAHVGEGIVATFDNPAAMPPVQPGAPGTLGIGRTPKVAAQGTGPGSSELAARVTITAPVSTRPGRYTGVLTLTIS